jgi:hypothetical protein
MSNGGLVDIINQKRAARGENKMPTGGTGKGSIIRESDKPSWFYLEEAGTKGNLTKFIIGPGRYKLVRTTQVEEYRSRLA